MLFLSSSFPCFILQNICSNLGTTRSGGDKACSILLGEMPVKETGREVEKAGSVAGASSGLTQVSGNSEKAGESLELWVVSGGGFSQATGESLSPSVQVLSSQHPVCIRSPAFRSEEQPTGRVTWAQIQ